MEAQARKWIALRIRLLRNARGWSQEKLAHASGLHRSYIGAVERGEHNIGIDNMEKIAAALGVPIQYLLTPSSDTRVSGSNAAAAAAEDVEAACAALPELATPVVINRSTFRKLYAHSRLHGPELLLSYLEACGAQLVD